MCGKSRISDSFIPNLSRQVDCVTWKRAGFYRSILQIRSSNMDNDRISSCVSCLKDFDNSFYPLHPIYNKENTSDIYDQLSFLYWELLLRFTCNESECKCLISIHDIKKEFFRICPNIKPSFTKEENLFLHIEMMIILLNSKYSTIALQTSLLNAEDLKKLQAKIDEKIQQDLNSDRWLRVQSNGLTNTPTPIFTLPSSLLSQITHG